MLKNNVLYCSITKKTIPPLADKKGQSSAEGGMKKKKSYQTSPAQWRNGKTFCYVILLKYSKTMYYIVV
jgi:hypothetical protein